MERDYSDYFFIGFYKLINNILLYITNNGTTGKTSENI